MNPLAKIPFVAVVAFLVLVSANCTEQPTTANPRLAGERANQIGNIVVDGDRVLDSEFRPTVDNLEIANGPTAHEVDGLCLGSTLTAIWYFRNQRRALGKPQLYGRFSRLDGFPLEWDNRVFRLASILNVELQSQQVLKSRREEGKNMTDQDSWDRLLQTLRPGEPQELEAREPDGRGHSLIAWKVDVSAGTVWIIDPAFPDQRERHLTFDKSTAKFAPYYFTQNGAPSDDVLGNIRLIPRDQSQWDLIATRWSEFEAGTLEEKDFQAPTITVGTAEGARALSSADQTPLASDIVIGTTGQNVTFTVKKGYSVYLASEGTAGFAFKGLSDGRALVVPVEPGTHRYGLQLNVPSKKDPQINDAAAVDVYPITVTTLRQLAFTTMPTSGIAGVPLTAGGGAVSVEIRDFDGKLLTQPQYVVALDLEPNEAGAVLEGTTTVSTIDGVARFSNVWVNRVGTSFRLRAIAVGTEAARSLPFDIVDRSVASVAVIPTNLTLAVGAASQLVVVVKDGAGNEILGRTTTWASQSTATATVSQSGLVTAISPGLTTVSASTGGVTGSATVTVNSPVTNRIAVVEYDATVSPLFTRNRIVSLDGVGQDRRVEYDFLNTLCLSIGGLSWSPDRKELSFTYGLCGDGGNFVVGVLNTNSRVWRAGGGRGPGPKTTWSPDGSKITYARQYQPPFSTGLPNPFLLTLSSITLTSETQLTSPDAPGELEPDYDPTGSFILFSCITSAVAVCRMPADGGAVTTLISGFSGPRHSSDGSLILMRRIPDGTTTTEVYVATRDGRDARIVASGAIQGYEWSPDGRVLLLTKAGLSVVNLPPVGGATQPWTLLAAPPVGVQWFYPTWR